MASRNHIARGSTSSNFYVSLEDDDSTSSSTTGHHNSLRRFSESPRMTRLESSISSFNFAMPHLEERMRRRLKYFFMNPCQKYQAKGRKPYKLTLQILKIFLVTIQLIIFGSNNQARVNFMDNNVSVFNQRFVQDNGTLYTKEEFYSQINHVRKVYASWRNETLGIFAFCNNQTVNKNEFQNSIEDFHEAPSPPVHMCMKSYNRITAIPDKAEYIFDPSSISTKCYDLKVWDNDTIHNDSVTLVNGTTVKIKFIGLIKINLYVGLCTIWMEAPNDNEPDCYQINITITMNNGEHSGEIHTSLDTVFHLKECSKYSVEQDDINGMVVFINFFDATIIVICSLSFVLCCRSLWMAQVLRKQFEKFYQIQYNKTLSCSDKLEFFNGWYLLILISDVLTVLGSILKMILQNKWKGLINYNSCSLFLGVGCLCVWIGVLRYAGFFNKYNILVVTLRKAMPHVGRFMVCASLLYLGFMFCGWVVLGPYHHKFRTLVVTSEAMFSLINGDDMYMTFEEMSKKSTAMLVFSQIYLYTFISLFIYVVLSLFIAVIMDTYETLKEYQEGSVPDPNISEIQKFIEPCTADVNQENFGFDLQSGTPCCCCFSFDTREYDDDDEE